MVHYFNLDHKKRVVESKLKSNTIRINLDFLKTKSFFIGFTTGVNFINIIRTNFLYERRFSSYMYIEKGAEMMFVQKICTFNVDEIGSR